jgi:uncharacterized damage-inducible protein DinB
MELSRLLQFDAWANREALESLRRARPQPPRAVAWINHIAATQRLWFVRMNGGRERVTVWPQLPLDDVASALDLNAADYAALIDSSPDLAREIDYVNSLGESYRNNVGDILMHVVMHGVHHRAQIAAELRASGSEPPYVDFIHAVRTGRID